MTTTTIDPQLASARLLISALTAEVRRQRGEVQQARRSITALTNELERARGDLELAQAALYPPAPEPVRDELGPLLERHHPDRPGFVYVDKYGQERRA